ncbi:MAG: hypothetical protein KKB81_00550 [Candidatus Margulisbacteria bacterium]|nr:hypothetical protein [Candidatus Margulisiibacteriota bacterium]MBU1022313.1 hypothetical protein [Candidatus Margulisiibacteriota bacterium]MBU1729926.1 hypothetical protein [Candidatus Margulisiibacteriota bacterium]MBU1955959.1 hypothetical protein [Candidatus Margulisiibacteriota bacterium]
MLKIIAILLSIVLLSQGVFAKTLSQNEVWSGKIKLSEDVTVPEGLTLTISPGTKVITNGKRIISYGTVDIQGQDENRVNFIAPTLTLTQEVAVTEVKPYLIDTKILKDEFSVFRVQYAILWSFLFASMFIMLEAR